MQKIERSDFAKQAEHALQKAVDWAIEQHRRSGTLIVVERNNQPTWVDPRTLQRTGSM